MGRIHPRWVRITSDGYRCLSISKRAVSVCALF